MLLDSLLYLRPILFLNSSLNQATKYRRSLRILQRRWLIKYRARLEMLEDFATHHVKKMVVEFPHLKLALHTFDSEGWRYKICYEYMADESIKFRYIW